MHIGRGFGRDVECPVEAQGATQCSSVCSNIQSLGPISKTPSPSATYTAIQLIIVDRESPQYMKTQGYEP